MASSLLGRAARSLARTPMGTTADWYRNVERRPQVRVWVGGRQGVVAVARPVAPSEARGHFEAYRAERPRTWRLLGPLVSRLIGHPGQTDEELFATVPLVELRFDARGWARDRTGVPGVVTF